MCDPLAVEVINSEEEGLHDTSRRQFRKLRMILSQFFEELTALAVLHHEVEIVG